MSGARFCDRPQVQDARQQDRILRFAAIVRGELEASGEEIALLSRSPRTATVVAATPLRVLAIDGRSFVELLDSLPELWLKVARALAERVDADEAAEAPIPT